MCRCSAGVNFINIFCALFCQYFGAKNYKAAQSAFTQNFATKMRFHMKNACVKRWWNWLQYSNIMVVQINIMPESMVFHLLPREKLNKHLSSETSHYYYCPRSLKIGCSIWKNKHLGTILGRCFIMTKKFLLAHFFDLDFTNV